MKKTHNKYIKQKKLSNHLVKKGSFGFKIKNFLQITENQQLLLLTKLIKQIKQVTKQNKKIWCSLYFNQNLTKISSESRMGKGKGSFLKKAIYLQPGNILFEVDNLADLKIQKVYRNFNKILPKNIILSKKYIF